MDITIPAALETLTATGRAVAALTAWGWKTKGDTRALILELRDNLTCLDLVAEDDISIADIIGQLSVVEYERLAKAGFNFNSLKRKKIAKLPSLDGTDLASWQGKRTGDLVESIYLKIRALKIRYPHVRNSPKYRWGVRVNNIRKRIWLLTRHLDS
jgi:hypothetical protein